MNSSELTPSKTLSAVAVAHSVWGFIAYRDQLSGIVRELPGSVGDGIFDKRHSRDARAAAWWFMVVGPLLHLVARLCRSAEAAEDREALRAAGAGVTAICAAGCVAIPRSGFPGGLAIGIWMMSDRATDVKGR
jgi:Family of unknown function (DUF6463)